MNREIGLNEYTEGGGNDGCVRVVVRLRARAK